MRNLLVAAVLLIAMLGFVVLALSGIDSLPRSPTTQAQLPTPTATATPTPTSRFEYDVLSGVGATGTTPTDVRMTSGWHYTQRNPSAGALDLGAMHGTDVHAVFRVVKSSHVQAEVKEIYDAGTECKRVVIKIEYKEGDNPREPLGDLYYLHVIPTVSVGDTIPLTGDLHPKKLGMWLLMRPMEWSAPLLETISIKVLIST